MDFVFFCGKTFHVRSHFELVGRFGSLHTLIHIKHQTEVNIVHQQHARTQECFILNSYFWCLFKIGKKARWFLSLWITHNISFASLFPYRFICIMYFFAISNFFLVFDENVSTKFSHNMSQIPRTCANIDTR